MTHPNSATVTGTAKPTRGPVQMRLPAVARRIPPAYSPLTASAWVHAATALASGDDARPGLCDALARAYAASHVVLLDSGTHALELALRLAARAAGGRPSVALPAYACYDVATAAVATGFDIQLYD
ncbi:MAG TPA: hypothetical protein VFT41_12935, partial [Gemmatimonadaceae bacterium]|nr:hypothetical protein [Gemmatimonadaceae bacterium]